MSNIFVDGFALYGVGQWGWSAGAPTDPVALAMLSGTYAEITPPSPAPGANYSGVSPLPWDPSNTDLYIFRGDPGNVGIDAGFRLVLSGGAADPLFVSCYFAADALPPVNNSRYVLAFCDGSNVIKAQLALQSTGALVLQNSARVTLASTSGPVIVAETATHLEMKIVVSTGAFVLYVNEVKVIDVTGLTFTGTGNTAQLRLLLGVPSVTPPTTYLGNLIVRDTTGAVNNGFVGDRRVATLLVNSDDVAHQGWTGAPRHRFGLGILDNSAANNACVTAPSSTTTNLGVGDFTIETSVRFLALPTGTNKAVIFGKWDEAGNKRSYQLYTGGPSLEGGNTVFRISTDGTAGTVAELISYPWVPVTDRWYHVAVSRASGETLLFVDGVQQGLPMADANTYYVGTELTVVGGQYDTGGALTTTSFNGWLDELRLTVGYARYAANFTPPVAAFPRSVAGGDAQFANVALLCGFDTGIFDESSYLRVLTSQHGAVAITPNDGTHNFQTLDKNLPIDDTFIEAALTSATSILTQTLQPVATKTVTVGTKDGVTAAVYTWVVAVASAFDVKIGTSINDSLANLVAAINAGAGAGTLYGTATTANYNVTAVSLPIDQILVTAITPGTGGNSVATSTTDTHGSWTSTVLAGGANIPGYSQFGMQRPPNNTTIIDSVTLVSRSYKTDAGVCTVQASLVGPLGAVTNGAANNITTVPTYYRDLFEANPDGGGLAPSTIISGKVRINRTA